MEVYDQCKNSDSPIDKGYVVSFEILNYKGYKDVRVHLFKPDVFEGEAEKYDWSELLGEPIRSEQGNNPEGSKKMLLETFTESEKDQVLNYLQKKYSDRLKSITCNVLSFPIPIGLYPLSEVQSYGKIGIIKFNELPNYDLNFSVHGLYDLSRHFEVSCD